MSEEQAWWQRCYTLWFALTHALIGLAALHGPGAWFSSPSLLELRETFHIPWPAYGVAYLLVPVMLAVRAWRPWGWLVAFVLDGWFIAVALYFTVFGNRITNPFLTGIALSAGPLAALAGLRYAARAADAPEDRS